MGSVAATPSRQEDDDGRRQRGFFYGAIAFLAAALVVSVVLVYRDIRAGEERALINVQTQLALVAGSRMAETQRWVDYHRHIIGTIADNPSVRIYFSERLLAQEEGREPEPGEDAYLANLLDVVAEREGFRIARTDEAVPANVVRRNLAGISVLDSGGNVIVASRGVTAIPGSIREEMQQRGADTPLFLDIRAEGELRLVGFSYPVYPIQEEDGRPAGYVLGVREIGKALDTALLQPGDLAPGGESYLVRRNGDNVEYLSRLSDGSGPLDKILGMNTPELVAAKALESPGSFFRGLDYNGTEVIGVSRAVPGTPWVLVRKMDLGGALAESRNRGTTRLVVVLGLVVSIGLGGFAVWKHGTSLRLREIADRHARLAGEHRQLSEFLAVLTDSQPVETIVVEEDNRISFANRTAAEAARIPQEDMKGKSLAAVYGPVRGKMLEHRNRTARLEGRSCCASDRIETGDGGFRLIKTDHIPLPAGAGQAGRVLTIIEDVSELFEARARSERIMKQLTGVLVGLIDRRDPWSSDHSGRVTQVASRIAREMSLSQTEIEAVGIAASVMNLGKILVPADLLTKTGSLSADEMKQVRDAVLASADLLDGVEFEGPVAPALRQLYECWDGSGYPGGLRGEAILVVARIIAVANAFVGMTSPRAWRPGMDFDAALDRLRKDVGSKYDTRPVSALAHILDNLGGRQEWQAFRGRPADAADGDTPPAAG